MIKGWHLVVAGLIVLVIEFFACWVPASMSGGQLNVGAVLGLTLIALVLIGIGVTIGGRKLNRETNGGVVQFLKMAGTAYVGYKVVIGTARHIHREITED